jgi:hypothetical protein
MLWRVYLVTVSVLVLALAGAIIVVSMHHGIAAAPAPQTINLSLSDMPPGYTQKQDQSMTGQQFATVQAGNTGASGESTGLQLINSREFDFQQIGGIPRITCSVFLYDSGDHALAAYTAASSHLSSGPITPLSLGSYGSTSTALTLTLGSGISAATTDFVLFQRGRYWALLGLADAPGHIDASRLQPLASLLDSRIKKTT